jgi:pyruvate,water dikinase
MHQNGGNNDKVRIWDNSNIAESYIGVVLPLTCSFARQIYTTTYINLARHSLISEVKINQYQDIFENLLGFYYGRFYYNITNWYKMMTLFPSYDRNKKNFNTMISLKTKIELDKKYILNVDLKFKIRYYFQFIVRYPLFEKEIDEFKEHIRKFLRYHKKVNFNEMDSKELLDIYYNSLNELLNKWSLSVENDFLLMTFFGMLERFCKKNELKEEYFLEYISNIKNVVSSDQVKYLQNLSKEFKRYPIIYNLGTKKKYKECLERIRSEKDYSYLKKTLENYLEIYGGRFANDLRLESEEIDENPEYIIKLLLLYSKLNIKNNKKVLEDKLKSKLSYYKIIYLNWLIKNIHNYSRNREELRLLRSQSFSLIRKIFIGISHKFVERGLIANWNDIFYLEIDEIKRYIEGSSITYNFKEIIKIRKKEYATYLSKDSKPFFVTRRDDYIPFPEVIEKNEENNLVGKGCSKGIVKGKVKVLTSFRLPDKEKFDIIVVPHTDPGWTPLFGLCKGIIVEHGGLLSHAAVISRELNLPCIIGVAKATTKFKDGQIITMNGSTGKIKLHE